jgi:alkanesulfonate monooxygenase SsuD/methylene tetrahydromethanopterin reductase-like flavin-dependent oxidoreductase (luciferase family)
MRSRPAGLLPSRRVSEPVEFGIYVPQLAFTYDEILARARLCEELGISSLWLFDHLYGPELPDTPAFEGWTLATALLAHTARLRVGHLVLCATFRHPALLAKMVATLDVISGGRLEVGLGSGSYEPEHARAGITWGTLTHRSELLRETLEILTRMSTGEPTTFDGEHFHLADLPNLPPPVQRPRPPIHVGGVGERRTLPLVARYADVWNVPTYGLGDLARKREVLAAECERIGRDPATIRTSLEAVMVLAPDELALGEQREKAERRFPGAGWGLHEGGFIGTPPAMVDRIDALVEQGVSSFVFFTSDRAAEPTLRLFASEVVPHFA